MRVIRILMPVLLLGSFVACGSNGSGDDVLPVSAGTLTVRLGSDSFPGYDQAVVSVEKVEWSSDGSNWSTLGNVKGTWDLMSLQNGHSAAILSGLSFSPRSFNQFRVTWATVNYENGAMQPAYVYPSGGTGQIMVMPTTTVAVGPVTVNANANTQALIMLSGDQAVQQHPGGAAPYFFQATAKTYDLGACASITGNLADGSTSLSDVEVYAETMSGTGIATIRRRAFTDASGNYVLEALPTGNLYYAVAQPAGTATSYAALASPAVNALSASTYTEDLAFSNPQTPGSVDLAITPASTSTQGTWGELRQTLATGTGSQTLIVRSQTVATGISYDQVIFEGVAPGIYGVTAERSTSGGAPDLNTGSQQSVSASTTTIVDLSY
jgi:hypothetical protein